MNEEISRNSILREVSEGDYIATDAWCRVIPKWYSAPEIVAYVDTEPAKYM